MIPFFVSQNLEAELSKKCDELRQLFLLQQQSNNNNNHGGGNGSGEDEATSPTSSSPPTSSTTAFLRSLRKLPSSTSNGGITKPEDEDSNSFALSAAISGIQPVSRLMDEEEVVAEVETEEVAETPEEETPDEEASEE